ncbi:hypothetical protein JZ751_011091 [Albula glossodonta]|uniref:Uncharacterized protein n=1 Tax=Albula glossodonta TaxID=121402 RepID=A0A8T2NZ54_9TELE|nr:hypothetical protein JZ751_011091 [Albula glossodonta]
MSGVNGVTPVKYDDMSQFAKKRNDKKKNLKKKSLAMKNEDGNEEGFPETSRSDPEEEARIREKAALDQVYRNIHLLQDVMHRRYAALLKEKIHKQRQEIRQRGMSIPKPKENPPKKVSQKADGTVGQRLPHRTLSHNDKYLKSLPKTSYYLIVDLQNQLARLGCLKTRQDHEEFWSMVGQNQGAARLEMRLREIREKS